MFAGTNISDDHLRWSRNLGMGFLLAGVFFPIDLLAVIAVLGAAVYICIRVFLYVRQRLAFHRLAG
jgi:hypothetical protein